MFQDRRRRILLVATLLFVGFVTAFTVNFVVSTIQSVPFSGSFTTNTTSSLGQVYYFANNSILSSCSGAAVIADTNSVGGHILFSVSGLTGSSVDYAMIVGSSAYDINSATNDYDINYSGINLPVCLRGTVQDRGLTQLTVSDLNFIT